MESQFRELCGRYFGFLVDDYSFKLDSDDSDTMLFRGDSVEIKITDCQMNEVSVHIQSNQPDRKDGAQSFLIENVLEAKTGKIQPLIEGIPDLPLGQLNIETQLEYYAAALRAYAEDVLQGNLSIFVEIDALNHKARRNDE
ncbi:MAG: hypothetical protein Q8T11_17775 [Elusimicrobiota bacterium]|nr:hypothetical protein [Elusimicrobiota bacterium]